MKIFRSRRRKPEGAHGHHWFSALGVADKNTMRKKLGELFATSLREGSLENVKGTRCYSRSLNDFLLIRTITIGEEAQTMYPVVACGSNYKATVLNVSEWENGVEAWARIQVAGPTLSLFAADYYRNKERYVRDSSVEVSVAALGYWAKPGLHRKIKDESGKEYSTGTMCALIPLSLRRKARPDDFWFQGQVLDARKLDEYVLFRTRLIRQMKDGSDFDIWVCVRGGLVVGQIDIGSYLSGALWLQGFLI